MSIQMLIQDLFVSQPQMIMPDSLSTTINSSHQHPLVICSFCVINPEICPGLRIYLQGNLQHN